MMHEEDYDRDEYLEEGYLAEVSEAVADEDEDPIMEYQDQAMAEVREAV